jgi:pSer/pThr/pTyr-binding forkhead associated (FHA) protein
VEHEVTDELCAYLLEHARREGLIMVSSPRISFHTDERLALGEFGIQPEPVRLAAQSERARTVPRDAPAPAAPAPAVGAPMAAAEGAPSAGAAPVAAPPGAPQPPAPAAPSAAGGPPAPAPPAVPHPPAPAAPPPRAPTPPPAATAAQSGETMIYSTSARVRGPLEDAQARRPLPRATLAVGARRIALSPAGGTVGRSRDCEIVLEDPGISRRHAEIRAGADGWTIADLGSTNGVLLNHRALRGEHPLQHGDVIELGSTQITFELK